MLAGMFAVPMIDWKAFPAGPSPAQQPFDYDAVIIGSGLGGLSCAAAFARQGFKPLVIEQHDKVGGFATAFSRPGGFRFDVSLHSTTVGQRNGMYNLIGGFPEITEVEFKQHPNLFRTIYPEHDIRAQQKDPAAFVAILASLFPDEKEGIVALFDDMKGLADDIDRLANAKGQVDMSQFPVELSSPLQISSIDLGPDGGCTDQESQAEGDQSRANGDTTVFLLQSCHASTMQCRSWDICRRAGSIRKDVLRDISNAFARFIESHGGRVLLNTKVEKILVQNGTATGVGPPPAARRSLQKLSSLTQARSPHSAR